MGKELSAQAFIISMAFVFLIGLSFIGGLYYILNQDLLLNSISYVPVSKEPTSFSLEINSPENDLLSFDQNVVISGKTAPLATIIIVNGTNTIGFESGSKGDFSKVFTLNEGPNSLNISSFDKTGAMKTVIKNIYYSKDKLEDDK